MFWQIIPKFVLLMQPTITFNPNIITWAIQRAGYDFDEFADQKFPKIRAWLDQSKQPTVRQLEEFSHKVHIPFGYLFLNEPPLETTPIPFFRTGNTRTNKVSLNVYDTILLLQRRQEWLSEYLAAEGNQSLAFIGKYPIGADPKIVAADMRQELGLSEDWAMQHPTWERAKSYLHQQIEELGVIISLNGVVNNNNTRKISVEECRGFVLVDPIAPFMFVNNNDGKAAQMFTIAHELAHIWLGQSAGFDFRQMMPADDPLEKTCNQIAAEFLVPEAHFLDIWPKTTDFRKISHIFKVSPIVAARRALDLGCINKPTFFAYYNAYQQSFIQKRQNISGGGDFYATQKSRLGLPFVGHLNQALKEGKILYRDAYRLTSLKSNSYQNFIQHQSL